MCGIIAGIYENIYKILYEGLVQLQNRGYDSAGICVFNNKIKEFEIIKKASDNNVNSLDILKENINNSYESNIGIGHTRWATHGSKTDKNSHPHISNNKKFVIVHNGIIENYSIIKEKLKNKNYKFYSETDSEVIVNLISYYYEEYNCIEKTIKKVITILEGTWGIVLMSLYNPETLYCFKNGSPILIGKTENECLIVSEESGFCNKINNYFVLDNNDICIIKKSNKIDIKTKNIYTFNNVQNKLKNLTPEPYKHWMIKEIYDQVETINSVTKNGSRIFNNKVKLSGLDNNIEILKNINNIILLGCGTSLNACNYSLNFFKELCNFNSVYAIDGADFNTIDIPKQGKTALILCSQSGETKDLHRCIGIANDNNLFTIGIVNVINSLISRDVNCGCYLHAGREVSVASTKSFTSQCLLLLLITCWFSKLHFCDEKKTKINKILNDVRKLPNDFKSVLSNYNIIKGLCKHFINKSSCFILGKGQTKFICDEGSLKIKEVSYIHSESYSSSSLKHGPFALLEKDFPVVLLCPNDKHLSKNLNAYEEIKSRYANIITVSNTLDYENNILIPNNDTFNSLIMILPLQIIAYELSLSKNINPDMPKNLAKVVTVE